MTEERREGWRQRRGERDDRGEEGGDIGEERGMTEERREGRPRAVRPRLARGGVVVMTWRIRIRSLPHEA